MSEWEKPTEILFWKRCPRLFLVVTWGSAVGSAWIRFWFWGKAICSYESKKKKEKDVKHQVHFDAWFNYFNYVSECVLVLTQHLLNFVWNSPSVHTVGWFIDVLLEVMMILTLSHFENQLHPSCHADASSHAVDSFFCTIRGSYGRRLKKKKTTEQY